MLKRMLLILMIVSVLVCAFSSCDLLLQKDAGKIIDTAEKQLDGADHTVNIRMVFTSDDEDMKPAIEAIDSSSVTLVKSGNDLEISLEMAFGEFCYKNSYVAVGNTIYNTVHSDLADTTDVKQKATLTAEDRLKLVNDAGAGEVLSYDDFDDVKVETNGDVYLITCKALKSTSADSLIDEYKSVFGDADTVSVKDTELIIRIVSGKYNGVYLSTVFSVTVDGVTYDVVMQATREYDHTTPTSVSVPDDADQYALVSYSEILK